MIDQSVLVKDIMTTNVVTVLPMTTMDKVEQLFSKHGFHHVLVVDKEGKLLGMLSKKDLVILYHNFTIFNRAREKSFNEHYISSIYAKEAMIEKVATLQQDKPLSVAVGIFKENLFHALPIINKEEKVVGILTTYDLLNYAY